MNAARKGLILSALLFSCFIVSVIIVINSADIELPKQEPVVVNNVTIIENWLEKENENE